MNSITTWYFIALTLVSLSRLLQTEEVQKGVDNVLSKSPNLLNLDYAQFVEKFHKSYGPLETLSKAKLFFGRSLKIFQHNVMFLEKKVNYFLNQNQYTDMTPAELLEIHKDKISELPQVAEALNSPDLPANSLLSVQRIIQETSGHSRCTVEDLKNNPKYDVKTSLVKPVLSFFEDQDVPDMRVIVQQLKGMPQITDKIERIVSFKPVSDEKEEKKIENAKKRNKITERLVVQSNNKNYEPQMVASSAANRNVEDFENYAKYFMDDTLGEINIMHYPEPERYSRPTEVKEGFGQKFMNTLRKIGDFLFIEPDYSDFFYEKEKGDVNPKSTDAEYDIDWRKSGCITKVRKQDNCNSCYAFATLGLLEFFHCKQTKSLTPFSSQYIVDCGSHSGLSGCRGGKISNVGQFIKKFGLELESMYPYSGRQDQCPFSNEEEGQKKAGYLRPKITHWQNFQDMAAWYKWIRKSPIIVGVSMPLDFLAYGGGVHDGLDCASDMTHAMLLVGSGNQDGKDFWLMKNSYSDEWGEKGYFKLAKNAPLRCFNSAIVARVSFESSKPK